MTLSCGSTLRLVPPRPRMRRQGSSSVLQGRRIRRHGRRSSLLAMAPLPWPAQKLRSLGIRLSTISRQRSVRSRPSRVRCTTPTRIRPSSYPRTGPSQPARVRAHTARTHACGRTCMPACTCTTTHAHAPWVRARKQMHARTQMRQADARTHARICTHAVHVHVRMHRPECTAQAGQPSSCRAGPHRGDPAGRRVLGVRLCARTHTPKGTTRAVALWQWTLHITMCARPTVGDRPRTHRGLPALPS
jgi:hypothetical protein